MRELGKNIQASILDRLIDLEPKISQEPVQRRILNFEQGKAAVIRDLENLLNTKRYILSLPPAYKEVNNSFLVYGVKDFTSQSPKSITVKKQLRQDLESIIAQFEPRLQQVRVHVEGGTKNGRGLRFRISGLLVLDPLIEPITFDTLFDLNRSASTIQG